MRQVTSMRCKLLQASLVITLGLALAAAGHAQSPTRVVGTVTTISGRVLTVKPDQGTPSTVTVSDTARILRAEPGAKKLSTATPMPFTDIAVGDRVLALVHGNTASIVIAMKHADIAQRQEAQAADWRRRGAAGLVKAVDTAAGTITIASGARTLVIHVTPATVIRRYSAESAQFADAKPSTLSEIHPGDQLRVLGDKNADESQITAAEIVSGSFRNIAGTILSINADEHALTVNDLLGKKQIVIHINADSQMHKLPPEMAQALASRLKHFGAGGAGRNERHMPVAQQGGSAANPGAPGAGRRGDLSQMLERTPTVTLTDLHQGDAVIIVATHGTPGSASAVTVLAGVEPILKAFPSGNQSMFSASWNLTGGAPGGAGGGGAPGGGGTP